MKSKYNPVFFACAVIFLILLLPISFLNALSIPAAPDNYVVDLAGIIDPTTESKLNQYLKELEQKTTAQLVILTIASLEGQSIEDFSITVAHDRWKLGRKGKDNGLLLLVSLKDRKYRIEVGYGLEGAIPDSLAGSIGRDLLIPFFRKGDYAGGIYTAALALTHEIAKESGVKITGLPEIKSYKQRGGKDQSGGLFNKIVSLVFFVVLIILFIRNPKLFIMFFLLSSMGRGGGWKGGGGFGGGGFGGGGGGGFGGGGASGSW